MADDAGKLLEQILQAAQKAEEAGFGDFADQFTKLSESLVEYSEFGDILTAVNAEFDDTIENFIKLQKAFAEGQQSARDFNNNLDRTIVSLTGVTDGSDTLVGSFFKLRKSYKDLEGSSEKQKELFDAQIESIKTYVDNLDFAASAAGALQKNTKKLLVANDEATAGFARATGMGKSFNSQILELEASNRQFGVTIDDSKDAVIDLVENLSGFTLMGADVQNVLATEVVQLERLGVSGATTTGVFESLTRTFGMNAQQSIALTQETETLAQELGISLNEAVSNLNKALPQLASLAADQVGPAFEDLQKRAVETGLAVNDLIGIAGRFDTFDEAASAAGNLNAVLGTQMFDTMGLLEAQMEGPDAVIEELRQGLLGSVGSFEELTVFQRKAIANASGLNEQEIRGLFLSEEITEEQKRQAEERDANLKATMDLKAELAALARELAIAIQPLMDFAKFIVSGFSGAVRGIKSIPGLGGGLGSVVAGAGVIGGGMGLNKLKNVAMEKLFGKKPGKGPDGSEKDPFFVRFLRKGAGADGEGEGGLMDKLKGKVKDKIMDSSIGQKFSGLADKFKPKGGGGLFSGLKNIGKKFSLGGLGRLGLRAIPGLGTAMLAYEGFNLAKSMFQDGGGIAGTGPVPITAHGGEVVVPVEKTPAASNLANMVAERSVNSGAMNALVKEIRNLNNRPIQVNSTIEMDNREFGRSVNKHFGAAGSKPANSAV